MIDVRLQSQPMALIEVIFSGKVDRAEIEADPRLAGYIKQLSGRPFRVLCDFYEAGVLRDDAADAFVKVQGLAIQQGMDRDAFVTSSRVVELQLTRLARSNKREAALGQLRFFAKRDEALSYLGNPDQMFAGIDFGTTNSTLALSDDAGRVELVRYTAKEREYDTFRSVLHFDPDKRDDSRGPLVTCGIEGIHAYLDAGSHGRFVQSVKSYLASRSFKSTNVFNRVFTLEQMITLIVSQLRAKAKHALPDRVVVGRPVHFVNDDDDAEGDAFAEQRLRQAIMAAGFKEVHFELEPVAAAYQYEAQLDKDELVLVADFGGGTTDLCLVDVGPGARAHRNVRATDGVALAGDTFDQRIIQRAIAPQLGLGGKYRVFGGDADVPQWLYASLARWHLLSFLKSPKTMQLLDSVVANAYDKASLSTLRRIVEDDLGYSLHQAVERSKIALSVSDRATIDFDAGAIVCTVFRTEFEAWIADDVARIGEALDRVLASANLGAAQVDRVFMTGGTSLVPAVRRLFAERFGANKLRGGEEMTSVGRGLALVARDVFTA